VATRTFVIVPAAGGGTRFSGGTVKQYADLAGAPLLARTLDRLGSVACAATLVALARADAAYEERVGQRAGVTALRCGGATRAETVRNALSALASRCARDDWIIVHDAARPCVPRAALQRLLQMLRDDPVGGLLAVPVADTLKRAEEGGDAPRVARTEERHALWQAQTPQMFRYGVLCEAFAAAEALAATDEAQAVETLAAGGRCAPPRLVPGSSENIKVTYPGDLALAAAILRAQEDR
jgi:2-C-methyl-D-erythritol 4-phosphate cytidylyltransferase